jgi:hypothetical protein
VLANDCENRASRNSPSLAVALNCGMGSNSLNAEVNALERLQIVRGRNSSYDCGKTRSAACRCSQTPLLTAGPPLVSVASVRLPYILRHFSIDSAP